LDRHAISAGILLGGRQGDGSRISIRFSAFQLEERDAITQLFRLLGESGRGVGDHGGLSGHLLAGRAELLGYRRVLLYHRIQLRNGLVYLLRPGVLLAAGQAYLLHQLRRLLDVRHHALQHRSGLLRHVDALPGQCRYLAGRYLAAFRELAHLAGDHRKALAVFAGPRRLDARVQ